jgi:hypothetical protein
MIDPKYVLALKDKINGATSCDELKNLSKEIQDSLSALVLPIQEKISMFAPLMTVPTNPLKIIPYANKIKKIFATPYTELIAILPAIATIQADLTFTINTKIAELTSPTLSGIPEIPEMPSGSHDHASHATGINPTVLPQPAYTIPDWSYPTVIASTPSGNNVPLDAVLSISFSKPIDNTGVLTLNAGSGNLAGSTSYNYVHSSLSIATFTPSLPLTYSTTYNLVAEEGIKDNLTYTINGITEPIGQELQYSYINTFTTIPDPNPPVIP